MEYINLVLPIFTALIAAWLAYHQIKGDKYKLKHDLFNKRLEVYKATHKLLDSLSSHDKLDEDAFQKYLHFKDQAHFIFSKKVSKKLEDYFIVAFEHRYFYGFGREKFKTDISKNVRRILDIDDDKIVNDNVNLNGLISVYASKEFWQLKELFKKDISLL